MPNVLSPRDLVFRPDIGHKLYHHQLKILINIFFKKLTESEVCISYENIDIVLKEGHLCFTVTCRF